MPKPHPSRGAAPLGSAQLLRALEATGSALKWDGPVEILLIGGAAGLITGLLRPQRTTGDCDVIQTLPPEAQAALQAAATEVARHQGLPPSWLSSQTQHLNVLPDGWRQRRKRVGRFGLLHVYAVGRLDLLAMKVYANRPQDHQDVAELEPTAQDLAFVRTYLTMLKVPSRQANLDQVAAAERYLSALAGEGP